MTQNIFSPFAFIAIYVFIGSNNYITKCVHFELIGYLDVEKDIYKHIWLVVIRYEFKYICES